MWFLTTAAIGRYGQEGKPMRRILIPLHVAEIGVEILPVVGHLFQPEAVELILLGITQRPESQMTVGAYVGDVTHASHLVTCTDEEWQSYRQRFEVGLKGLALGLRNQGYQVHTLVRVGEPVATILSTVQGGGYDLIALATRPSTGLARWLSPSIADRLLRRVALPVLLLHPEPVVKPAQVSTLAQSEMIHYEPSLAHVL
jgi:Universal stress protein family